MTTRPSSGGQAPRSRVTDWVLAHKLAVAIAWLALTIAGLWGASEVTSRLEDQYSLPPAESFVANEEIKRRFGSGGATAPLVAVVALPGGHTVEGAAVRRDLRRLERDLRRALPRARLASYGSTVDRAYVSADGRTTFAIVHPRVDPDAGGPGGGLDDEKLTAARAATERARVGGARVLLTGQPVLEATSDEGDGPPELLSETLIAGVAALGVLAFVFASALAVVPIVMAVVAIPVTLLAILGLTQVVTVSSIVVFLVALVGLGIAVDYALVVVMRWREERDRGRANEDAVRVAIATAGRATLFSGTTVAIGLLAAVVLPVPFLRSMG